MFRSQKMKKGMRRLVELLCSIQGLLIAMSSFLMGFLIMREIQYINLLQVQKQQIACRKQIQEREAVLSYQQTNLTLSAETLAINPYRIAIGVFSVHRPNAPDYVYAEVMSILDSMKTNETYIQFDYIHVFDGSFNGSQVRYFKYARHIRTHPMDPVAFEIVKNYPVHRKASLNYLLALRYLTQVYEKQKIDAYLMLEDDLIFDPQTSYLIWKALNQIHHQPLFLVDGYVKGPMHTVSEENDEDPLWEFKGDARCCSQAFLLSPEIAKRSIPLIEQSLNGSLEYFPLDVFLTTSLLKIPDFHFYFAKHCWVQHVGYPVLGLGIFHRGGSRMEFD